MRSLRSISLRLAGTLLLAATSAACVIEPNQIPDAGVVDGGGTGDGGPDAGIVGGAISATVGTTSSGSQVVSWTGLQLAGSSSSPVGGATQVLVNGQSDTGGILSFYLTNLAPTTTSATLASIGYQAPSTAPDGWTCDPNPNPSAGCSGTVGVSSYDGHTLVGTFSAQFGPASSVRHTSFLSLSNGAFSLTLP